MQERAQSEPTATSTTWLAAFILLVASLFLLFGLAVLLSNCMSSSGGDSHDTEYVAPAGVFRQLDVAETSACALREDGQVVCWGQEPGSPTHGFSEPGPYARVSVGVAVSCVLTSADRAVGFCHDVRRQDPTQHNDVIDVAAGDYSWCLVLQDGDVDCWTEQDLLAGRSILAAPPRPFVRVSVGRWYAVAAAHSAEACGLGIDRRLQCWGNEAMAPEGEFTDVSVGDGVICAVRATGQLSCWGEGGGAWPPYQGTYLEVSAGRKYYDFDTETWKSHACAIRTDRALVCWGDNHFGQAQPPPGEFLDVSAGMIFSAAITTDGSIVWWGRTKFGYYDYDDID